MTTDTCKCGHGPDLHDPANQGPCFATTDPRGMNYCLCARFHLEGTALYGPEGHLGKDGQRIPEPGPLEAFGKALAGMGGPASERALGEALKDQGMARAEQAQDEADLGAWRDAVDAQIESFAQSGGTFTAEDVLEAVGQRPVRANAVGARFSSAARRGLITQVGSTTATRGPAHGRLMRVWAGA